MAVEKSTTSRKILPTVMLVISAILLFLAQSAYWVNHSVFDQQNFSKITTGAIQEQSSRDAIATAVVDKALSDRPVLQRTVGDRAVSLISGLLGSDLSSQAISALTSKTYAYATSSDRQDIRIDLTSIKSQVGDVISLAQSKGVNVSQPDYKLPDQITLLKKSSFPDFSGLIKLMLWIGPLLWIGAIVLFALYIYLGRAEYARRVYMVGLAIVIVSLVGLFAKPFVPPPVAAAIPNIDLRPIAQNLASGFLSAFAAQMWWMLGITVAALVAFNQRFNLLSLVESLKTKTNKPSASAKKR